MRSVKPGDSRQRTLVERVLSPIADVRQEEAAGALPMTLLMFLILAAYYELKTAREVFILSQGGILDNALFSWSTSWLTAPRSRSAY